MARSCVFCGASGVTLEHVIPQWVSEVVLGVTQDATGFTVGGPAFIKERSEGRNTRVIDFQVKRVCRDCNHGWMSDLETEAQEFLKPMITGHEVRMGHEVQTIIAKWAVKTAMMVEFTTPARVFAKTDREHLCETGTIPDGHSVFLAAASIALATRGYIFYIPLRIPVESVEHDLSHVTNGYALTFSVRHLVFQVIGSGKVGGWEFDVDHPATDIEVAVPIWPLAGDIIRWPPRRVLPDAAQLGKFGRMVLPNR